MVDEVRLRNLLSRLRGRLNKLTRYASLDVEEYLADDEGVDASKYVLLTAIEDALSIANHVIASEGFRAPIDYADAFRSLHEAEVLDRELAERLEAMARFRNLLVHVYADVDDRRVHSFLSDDLQDMERFAAVILRTFSELESQAGS